MERLLGKGMRELRIGRSVSKGIEVEKKEHMKSAR